MSYFGFFSISFEKFMCEISWNQTLHLRAKYVITKFSKFYWKVGVITWLIFQLIWDRKVTRILYHRIRKNNIVYLSLRELKTPQNNFFYLIILVSERRKKLLLTYNTKYEEFRCILVHIMRSTPHIHNALIDDIKRYGTFISTCTYCIFLLQHYETYYSPKTPL